MFAAQDLLLPLRLPCFPLSHRTGAAGERKRGTDAHNSRNCIIKRRLGDAVRAMIMCGGDAAAAQLDNDVDDETPTSKGLA